MEELIFQYLSFYLKHYFVFSERSNYFCSVIDGGDKKSPLVFLMIPQSAKEKIEEFINQNLESESHFLVQVNVGNEKAKSGIVQILLDSDSGITIEECATYSRKTGKFLEENELFENAYTLEVASPGLDFPLSSERQYLKNIGRSILVDLKSETSPKEGKLISYQNEILLLEVEEKIKGKKAQIKLIEIPADQIIKAKVTVSFK